MSFLSDSDLTFTVLIPVYNCEEYLEQSLSSVLGQQTKADFNVLVIDDGSSDKSLKIALTVANRDARVEVISLPHSGLVFALNHGLVTAKGNFVIRHDADDIMIENRINSQHEYLLSNPNCVLVGGQLENFSDSPNDQIPIPNVYPQSDLEIRQLLPFKNTFAHPAATFCRMCANAVEGYRKTMNGAEDYDLWIRLSVRGSMHNLTSTVTKYRKHPNQVTVSNISRVYRATLLTKLAALWVLKPKLQQQGFCSRHGVCPFPKLSKISLLKALVWDLVKIGLVIGNRISAGFSRG